MSPVDDSTERPVRFDRITAYEKLLLLTLPPGVCVPINMAVDQAKNVSQFMLDNGSEIAGGIPTGK
jgi:hypothetical protein